MRITTLALVFFLINFAPAYAGVAIAQSANSKDSEAKDAAYLGESFRGGICAESRCTGANDLIVEESGYPEKKYDSDEYHVHKWEAAQDFCFNLTTNGYSDWYLPDSEELRQLYQNKDRIGGFSYSYYWTSDRSNWFDTSSYHAAFAWRQRFSDGTRTVGEYDNPHAVRCVRWTSK